jgi:hypothetical protein
MSAEHQEHEGEAREIDCVPTERSMPPTATTSVIPIETIARSAKLLTRTLARFWTVGKVGIDAEKTASTAISASGAE